MSSSSTQQAFTPLPTDKPKGPMSCKWCGNYIYIIYAELSDGRRRYVPVNEGNHMLHDCPLKRG